MGFLRERYVAPQTCRTSHRLASIAAGLTSALVATTSASSPDDAMSARCEVNDVGVATPLARHGMVYIEFLSRRSGIELDHFRSMVQAATGSWDAEHDADDRVLLSVGRTWRLGPEVTEYFTVWHSPHHRLNRIDEWDAAFRSGLEAEHVAKFRVVARIDVAGCYEPLLPPVPAHGGTYYVEWFSPSGSSDEIREWYAGRLQEARDALRQNLAEGDTCTPPPELSLLATRVGMLAPEPGGVAVWTLPSFGAMETTARSFKPLSRLGTEDHLPVVPFSAGTYADLGKEML